MSALYVILTVVFFISALPVCLLAYHYFTHRSIKFIPFACAVWHVISLYTCIVAFPLLVLDIDASFDRSIAPQVWMRPMWLSIFIMTYICAWVTLPVAQMYTEVGEFTVKSALWHSISLNLKLYLIIFVFLFSFLLLLVILKGAYTSLSSIGKVIISLANAWGLLMLLVFMPSGLVGVPRLLWRNAQPAQRLCRVWFEAVDMQEALDLATRDLTRLKREVTAIEPLVEDDHRGYLSSMLEAILNAEREVPLFGTAAHRVGGTSRAIPSPQSEDTARDISLPHLVEMHERLKKAIKIAIRVSYRWQAAIEESLVLDRQARGTFEALPPSALGDNFVPAAATSPSILASPSGGSLVSIWESFASLAAGSAFFRFAGFQWRKHRSRIFLAACGVSAGLTLMILLSELTMPFRSHTSFPLSLVEVLMRVPGLRFSTSVVVLFYMAYCSFWAAFQVRVFDIYVMFPGIADNASLCFNEVFLVRLLMPLCFNFLLICGLAEGDEDVQYGHVYRRNMDITLLFGPFMNQYLPILFPIVALVVLMKLTSKIMSSLGIEVYDPDDIYKPSTQERIQHGKRLIEAALGYPLGQLCFDEANKLVRIGDTENVSGVNSNREAVGEGDGRQNASPGGKEERGSRYRAYLAEKERKKIGGNVGI